MSMPSFSPAASLTAIICAAAPSRASRRSCSAVRKFAAEGGLVLGICNGFQILVESGLLPGALLRNEGLKFVCREVTLRTETTDVALHQRAAKGQALRAPVAHGEGCYFADDRTLDELEAKDRVVFRYLDNPNGSLRDIAGILNKRTECDGHDAASRASLRPLDGVDGRARCLRIHVRGRIYNFPTTITPELIAQHQLTPAEYQQDVGILGREPSYTELGIFTVMWSEHCSYKSSRIHLKKLPTRGQVGGARARRERRYCRSAGSAATGWPRFKIESHNHPSYIEPFQGAATGVGGILRDIFTMGARPIAVMDSLRFGSPTDPDLMWRRATGASSRGWSAGIAHYGNCFGVPTVGGETIFDSCYNGNPLVNVFALGVCRKDEIFYAQSLGYRQSGDLRGREDRPGRYSRRVHGRRPNSPKSQSRSVPNVQVGDPFLEKLLLEACLEAMKTGAIVGIQDMGAAGLTSLVVRDGQPRRSRD